MIPLDTGLLYRPSPTILENVGRLNTGLLGAIPQLALSGAPDWFFPKLVALLRPFEPKTSVISGSLPCDTSKTLEYNMKSFTSTAGSKFFWKYVFMLWLENYVRVFRMLNL